MPIGYVLNKSMNSPKSDENESEFHPSQVMMMIIILMMIMMMMRRRRRISLKRKTRHLRLKLNGNAFQVQFISSRRLPFSVST